MSKRHGEADKLHFRAERFQQSNGQWFFLTREGTQHGPYATREQAATELKFYLRKIGSYDSKPKDPDSIKEENRRYDAIDSDTLSR